jgi:hypothetical protein
VEQTNRTGAERTETGAPLDPGVYAITNTETGRVLIGSTMNLMAVGNSLKLARSHGITGVLDPRLLADWARFGADAFTFRVLDRLAPDVASAEQGLQTELTLLQTMWQEKLAEETLY